MFYLSYKVIPHSSFRNYHPDFRDHPTVSKTNLVIIRRPGSLQRATLLLVSCIVLLKCNFLNVYFHLNIFAEPDKIHYKPEKVWTVHLSERCCRITIQSCGRNISFIFNNFRFKIFVLSVEYFKYLIQRIKNQIQHYMLCFSYREL